MTSLPTKKMYDMFIFECMLRDARVILKMYSNTFTDSLLKYVVSNVIQVSQYYNNVTWLICYFWIASVPNICK